MKFDKSPKTISEQIELLKSRGLIVEDESKLERYLQNISYYHFSIYFKHFQKNDVFIDGASFEDVLNVYVFDQKLRMILLDLLERIEKSFKCRMVYEMSTKYNDSHWIGKKRYFSDIKNYKKNTIPLLKRSRNSKEVCVRHYYKKYTTPPFPPAWTVVELLTFGESVMIFGQLSKENKKIIAQTYGLNKKFIYNWMYALSNIRNFCAHHSRLWNREFVISLTQKHGLYTDLFENSNGNRLFNYLVVMQVINCKFNPDSKWIERLEKIIDDHNVNISHMGCPDDWKERLEKIKNIELEKEEK